MARTIPNLCCIVDTDGPKVVRLTALKQKGDTYARRAGKVASVALSYRCTYFAMRVDRRWHLYPTSGPRSIRTFPSQAAAEMWLLHRGRK